VPSWWFNIVAIALNLSEMSEIETNIPSVLIAGTHSGVGKTTVTLGLMAALRARGLKVQPFKVGPDFIDPSHHTAVCGRPSHNLDPFMMGEDGVRRSFCSALAGADVGQWVRLLQHAARSLSHLLVGEWREQLEERPPGSD